MAADDRSLTYDPHLQRLSKDVTQDNCKMSDYNTFEQEEMPDRNKMNIRKMNVITICIANLSSGMMYSLVAPFYAIEVS